MRLLAVLRIIYMKSYLSEKQKKHLIRIVAALVAFVVVFAVDKSVGIAQSIGTKFGWLLPFGLYLAIYIVIGYDVIARAAINIAHGEVFDENFLMLVATLGAFALAIYRGATGLEIEGFDEACAVLLFYQLGEFFQSYAVGRSRKDIAALMDIRPDKANVLRDGEAVCVSPDEVSVGEVIEVYPGEKVPLDGVCISGASALDTKALTGESMPRDVTVGDRVLSGVVNLSSTLTLKVEKTLGESTVSKILDLVENASEKKSRTENFISKFAKYYTPCVVFMAIFLAIIPGAITGDWSQWVYRALSFLVVSCPCALVISIPLSFFAGIGAASRYGILVKGSSYLEQFNRANIFVFDKTGTLTNGNFEVISVTPEAEREEILRLAATAETGSSHPIALSILACCKEAYEGYTLTNEAGMGVIARRGEDEILCGNEKLMSSRGITVEVDKSVGSVIYVAHNGVAIGSIVVADTLKPAASDAIVSLKDMGARAVMLTGDSPEVARSVAERLGISEYRASLLPSDKVDAVENLLGAKGKNDKLCFVGDGINDAPVLMRSDIGIAMGGIGSDAAIEASDIVLMQDDLKCLPLAKRIAKKTMAVVTENIIFSLTVKAIILVLSALGITNMWVAVFGDVGVAVLAIINAMRVNTIYRSGQPKHKHTSKS